MAERSEVVLHKKHVVRTSGFVLVSLYILYSAIALPFVLAAGADFAWILGLATLLPFIALLFFYWFAPVLITWSAKVTWRGAEVLPKECQTFLTKLCSSQHIKNLSVGLVDTSIPNAFVYGRRRAPRLVFTRGILERLPLDELNAVIAHEVGHLGHRDFLVLATAMVIPMIFFRIGWQLFSRGGNSKAGLGIRALGIIFLSIYWVSKLIYLVLSRARELYADSFSADVTGDPDSLARALVRITCEGALQQAALDHAANDPSKARRKAARREQAMLRPISALAIDDLSRRWLSLNTSSETFSQVTQMMRWDVTNPWAVMYQTGSSHPLTTFRIARLNRFTREAGRCPSIIVPAPGKRPWVRFSLDLGAYVAPYVGLMFVFRDSTVPFIAGAVFRLWYRYHGKEEAATAADLMGRVDASSMNPLRVRMYGTLKPGNQFGVSGEVLFDGSDVVPVRISPWSLVARLRLPSLEGKQVAISGWYRRGDTPWIEPLWIEEAGGQALRVQTRVVKMVILLWFGIPAIRALLVGFN